MKRVLIVIAGQAAIFGLQLGAVIIAARLLGASGQGVFAVIRTAVYLGEGVLWVGLNSGLLYWLSSDFKRYCKTGLLVSSYHLFLALLFGFGAIEILQGRLPTANVVNVLCDHKAGLLSWLAVYAALQVCQRILLSAQRFEQANMLNIVSTGLVLPLTLLVAFYYKLSVADVVLVNIIGNLAALGYGVWVLKAVMASEAPLREMNWGDVPGVYRVGLKGFASTLAFLALYRMDLLLVAHFLGVKTLGVYAVAVFVTEAAQKVSTWLATMLTPKVAAGQDETGRLTLVYSMGGASVVVCFGLFMLGCHLSGWNVLQKIVGADYTGVDLFVLMLVPKTLLYAVMVVYAGFLSGKGYTLYHPGSGAAAVLITLLADLWLIPKYGIGGAVIGVSAGYTAATAIMVFGAKQVIKGRPYALEPSCS